MSHGQQKQKKRFVLTMRNQKGQVGIFVALIFQVIFVFFAMLVNVGLVVHHKINLQQSTDLAAYYGAMKQAEIMNVMGHVNFQIRQAWKLMAWRYRVLGTFGFENKDNNHPITYPVVWAVPVKTMPRIPKYVASSRDFSCSGAGPNSNGLTVSDIPFMCMGHNGFHDWPSGTSDDETFCKVDCDGIEGMASFSISAIKGVSTAKIYNNSLGQDIDNAIKQANKIVAKVCNSMSPINAQMLAMFYSSYIKEVQNRKQFISMLNKNLGLPEKDMRDIEGKLVFDGVKNTLKNNLTEANLSSMTTDASIQAFNGVKSFNGGVSFAESMLKEITFQKLLFFVVDCLGSDETTKQFIVKSLYSGNTLDANVVSKINAMLPAVGPTLIQLLEQNSELVNSIGFEKNPWIPVYYGVKAVSEPKIPFLPLAKIKLQAISFAKPFGGTIGPWYFKNWDSGTDDNTTRTDWANRTDKNLPRTKPGGDIPADNPTLRQAREFFFNYSTHVGDPLYGGLANKDIYAFYTLMLANKLTHANNFTPSENIASKLKLEEPKKGLFDKPDNWPKYTEWYHTAKELSDPQYDPLAIDNSSGSPRNTYMRDIELTVVSPNQFDATYYSIDPDFAMNYGSKLTKDVIQTISTAAGFGTPPIFPRDFGNPGDMFIPGILEDATKQKRFGVRHQIQVTHDLFKAKADDIVSLHGNTSNLSELKFGLDVLATKQSSLLTGWTFLNLTATGYNTFPGPQTSGPYSMLFGKCDEDVSKNPWTANYQAPYEIDSNLPPIPGNCLTGGRTGYSVKLISSEILRSGVTFENLGGPGMTGTIKNPVPDSFLQFGP